MSLVSLRRSDGLFGRGLVLGVMTVIASLLSMLVALGVGNVFLPATDGAKRETFVLVLADPVLFPAAVSFAVVMGMIAYPFAFLLLVRTRLERSIPLVLAATILGTALGSVLIPGLLAAIAGLVSGVLAMLWSRRSLREEPLMTTGV